MSYLDTAKWLSQNTRFYKRGFKTLITSWSANLGTLSFLSCAVSHRWSSVQLLEQMLWDWGCCPCLPRVTPTSLCHLKTVTQSHLRCRWVTKASADMILAMGGFTLQYRELWTNGTPEMSQRVLGAFFRSLKQLQFPKQDQLCGKGLMLDGRSSELSLKPFVPLALTPGPKLIPWSKLWLEFPFWGTCIWPQGGLDGCSDYLGKPTRWSSCLRDQAPARSWGNRT